MMKLRLVSLCLLTVLTRDMAAQSSGKVQAVRTFFADADVAWNNHNAQQLTNLQNATADSDFVNVYGGWAKGLGSFVPIMTRHQAGPH